MEHNMFENLSVRNIVESDANGIPNEKVYIPDGAQVHYEYERYYKEKSKVLREQLDKTRNILTKKRILIEQQNGKITLLEYKLNAHLLLSILNSFAGIVLAVISTCGSFIQQQLGYWSYIQPCIISIGITLILVYLIYLFIAFFKNEHIRI